MIALRRMRARTAVFAALAAVALVLGALGVGVAGYLTGSSAAGASSGVAALRGAQGAYRVGVRLAGNAEKQDAGIRRLIARAVGSAPVTVSRTLATRDPLTAEIRGDEADVVVLSDPGLRGAARLQGGAWPASARQVAVQADAARRLGLAPGDDLRIDGRSLRVAGTWRARDAEDPRWAGDAAVRGGRAGGGEGPIVVAESVWSSLDTAPLAQYTVVPDADRIERGDLEPLGRLSTDLPREIRASSLGASGVVASGGMPAAVRVLERRLAVVDAAAPVPLLVLAVIAALAVIVLGRLLALARSRESELLRSRGSSPRALAAVAAAEAGAVGAIGAAAGSGVGAGAVLLALGSPPPLVLALGVPIGVAVLCALGFGGGALAAIPRPPAAERSDPAARVRRLAAARRDASIGAVVLSVGAAAVATWRFLGTGSGVDVAPNGSVRVDPLAVLAPALDVLAVAVVALALAPVVAAAAARRFGGGARLDALVVRRMPRSVPEVAAPIALLALATATLVLAAGYAATWERSSAQTRAVRLGADVVATGATTAQLASAGRDGSALVASDSALLGVDPVTLVGVRTADLRTIASSADGAVDRSALAGLIRVDAPGIAIPSTARELRFSVRATPLAPTAVTIHVLENGIERTITARGEENRTASLPGRAGIRLLAIDVTVPAQGSRDVPPVFADVRLDVLRVDAGELRIGPDWVAPFHDPEVGDTPTPLGAVGASLQVSSGAPTTVRLMPPAVTVALPAVLSTGLAERNGLRRGSAAQLDQGGFGVRLQVAGLTDAVPGDTARGAVLVDLDALRDAELRVGVLSGAPRLWATGDAEGIRSRLPSTATVQTVSAPQLPALAAIRAALASGAAGCLLIAVVALAAVTGSQTRTRSGEVAVLRALGVSPAEQARQRRLELAPVLGYGIVLGLVGGIGVVLLVAPGLATAATIDPVAGLPVWPRVDPIGLAIGLVVLGGALAGLLLVSGRRLADRARTALVAEDGS